MAEETYNVEFNGYRRNVNIGGLPTYSGVYTVYRCIYNVEEDNVSVNELIYIGKAGNIRTRIGNHEKTNDWEDYLEDGEILCFGYANVSEDYNERVEAALIFRNQPPENTEYKNSFPYEETTVNLSGRHVFIIKNISLETKLNFE